MALFHARRSGRGQVADLGSTRPRCGCGEAAVRRAPRPGGTVAGAPRHRVARSWCRPTSTGRADGGWIAVSGAGDQPFARLCEAIEAPDAPKDPRFATPARAPCRTGPALRTRWSAPGSPAHDQADVEARFARRCGVADSRCAWLDDIVGDAHREGARRPSCASRRRTGRGVPRARGGAEAHARRRAAPPRRAPDSASTPRRGPGGDRAALRRQTRDRSRRWNGAHRDGPLRGARCSTSRSGWPAPRRAALLGDFGADVIMVELPSVAADAQGRKSPDLRRHQPRNKRSITLDVRAPARPRGVPARWSAQSDVIVENFRPGHARALGPGAGRPSSRPIRGSCSCARPAFGQSGPLHRARRVQPWSGRASAGSPISTAGPTAAAARDGVPWPATTRPRSSTSWAWWPRLLRRDADGQGQVVDTRDVRVPRCA